MTLAQQQLELLERMSAFDFPPRIMGGYAEDALLHGTVTRPHGDIDWLVPRSELPLRRRQAEELGFEEFDIWGEAAPGEPFYLFGQTGDLKLEVGILDEADGELWMCVHKLMFDIGGKEAPAGYRLRFPPDTFDHPPVELDGIRIWTPSPLALYQLRVGVASQGSFGPLSPRHEEVSRRLKEAFFPDRSEAELEPHIERLM